MRSLTPTKNPTVDPNRRAVLRGAVWAAPVIAVAVAAPAASASGGGTSTLVIHNFNGTKITTPVRRSPDHKLNGLKGNLHVGNQVAYPNESTITSATLLLSVPVIFNSANTVVSVKSGSSSSWTVTGSPIVGAETVTYTFVFAGSIRPNQSLSLKFEIEGVDVPLPSTPLSISMNLDSPQAVAPVSDTAKLTGTGA